ncbi:MAG: AI-2E family transporter, partial [Chloroflexota bacterium]
MSDTTSPPPSPLWNSATKLIVGLTFVGILIALLIYFRSIIGPLLLAVILAYVLHPVAAKLSSYARLNWRWSVNIVFLSFVLILLAILTVSGFAIIQQMESLVRVISNFTVTLPDFIERISSQIYSIGPYTFSLDEPNLQAFTNQFLDILQPILGSFGSVISSFAASALVTLGWILFVLVIAYFLLARTGQVTDEMIQIDIPGYNEDIQQMNLEFRRIWNVFLRGQMVIFILAIILYSILLTTLGVRYALGIAIMAGVARFIPYVGPFIVWVVTAFGLNCYVFIPSRTEHGYGLNEKTIASFTDKVRNSIPDLLIVVDSGSSNEKEVLELKEFGIDKIIIIDHHIVNEEKISKSADALVN